MDEKAQRFSEECGPYAGMVYRHCLHMLSRPEEAEDAAQESMLRAFRAYDGYRGEGTATWLYRIAHNTCLDILPMTGFRRRSIRRPRRRTFTRSAPGRSSSGRRWSSCLQISR